MPDNQQSLEEMIQEMAPSENSHELELQGHATPPAAAASKASDEKDDAVSPCEVGT